MNAVFFASRHFAIYSSRSLLIEKLISEGWGVYVVGAPDHTTGKLKDIGAYTVCLPINRNMISPIADWKVFIELYKLARQVDARLVHCFHVKPVLIGGLLGLVMKGVNAKFIATITGLGRAFSNSYVKSKLASFGYKFLLRGYSAVVFQNSDDQRMFESKGWINKNKSKLIVSSGVNLSNFSFNEKASARPPRVFFVSRLIKQKGVSDFIEVARLVRKFDPRIDFVLGGELDTTDIDCVDEIDLSNAHASGLVQVIGYVGDVADELSRSSIFLYPSTYREGVPRVAIEAAASGLPVLAYDVPGTREAVVDGVTGYLLLPGDVCGLVDKVLELSRDPNALNNMSRQAREFAESNFCVKSVTNKYMELYKQC